MKHISWYWEKDKNGQRLLTESKPISAPDLRNIMYNKKNPLSTEDCVPVWILGKIRKMFKP